MSVDRTAVLRARITGINMSLKTKVSTKYKACPNKSCENHKRGVGSDFCPSCGAKAREYTAYETETLDLRELMEDGRFSKRTSKFIDRYFNYGSEYNQFESLCCVFASAEPGEYVKVEHTDLRVSASKWMARNFAAIGEIRQVMGLLKKHKEVGFVIELVLEEN